MKAMKVRIKKFQLALLSGILVGLVVSADAVENAAEREMSEKRIVAGKGKAEAKKQLTLENLTVIAQGDILKDGGGLYYLADHKGWPKFNYSMGIIFDYTKHTEKYEEYNVKSDWKGWMMGVRVTRWSSWSSERFEPYIATELNRANIKTSYVKNVPYNLDIYAGAKFILGEIPIEEWGKNIILSSRMELGAGYVGGDGFSFAPVNMGFEIQVKNRKKGGE